MLECGVGMEGTLGGGGGTLDPDVVCIVGNSAKLQTPWMIRGKGRLANSFPKSVLSWETGCTASRMSSFHCRNSFESSTHWS